MSNASSSVLRRLWPIGFSVLVTVAAALFFRSKGLDQAAQLADILAGLQTVGTLAWLLAQRILNNRSGSTAAAHPIRVTEQANKRGSMEAASPDGQGISSSNSSSFVAAAAVPLIVNPEPGTDETAGEVAGGPGEFDHSGVAGDPGEFDHSGVAGDPGEFDHSGVAGDPGEFDHSGVAAGPGEFDHSGDPGERHNWDFGEESYAAEMEELDAFGDFF